MSGEEHYVIKQILRMLSLPQGPAGGGTEERELRTAEAFIRFMDEMPGGFLIYYAEQDERIIYANQSLLRIFGCETMEEFRAHTGNSFRGMVYPEDREAVEKSIRTQIANSRYDLDYVEYRIRRRDGVIRWIEDYGHYINLENVGGIFYVFLGDATRKRKRILTEKNRLISENLKNEQKIRTLIEKYDREYSLINREYLQQLEVIEGLSANYESICYVNLDEDQIVPYRLSCRTRELFEAEHKARGYARYVSDYAAMWVHPEDREAVLEATSPDRVRERLADSRTYYLNYRVLVKEETQFIQLRVVDVGHHGSVNQVVLGYRRVDEEIQRQMEQQTLLAEALAKANLAVTSKNEFLSNISHDMRTPLHAIFGFTSLAKLNLNNPEETRYYLNRVEAASRQLLDMINKVLEISALSESAGVEETECGLREVADEVYEFLAPQAKEKELDFSLDCGGLRHNTVFVDRDKLRQLILYLTNNAVTYTNSGGRVTISITEGEELPNNYAIYLLSVQDTGIGISPEFLEKAFEPFSREKNTTLSGVHGIGLGLTIAKNIADLMGGHISARSKVGEGSTFNVSLTLRFRPKAAGQKPFDTGETLQRILLAEDNEINREIETELLERLGFSIEPAENGKLALDKIAQSAPGDYDLILMDLQMPVMNGWEAAVAIRSLPNPELARIPIIALSANALPSDLRRSKESGMDAHLAKPMDLALLLDTIEKITGKLPPVDRALE